MATLMPDIFDKPVVIHRDGRIIMADTVTPERLREARHRMAANGRRVRYEVRHAPHNMRIGVKDFRGGEFIPPWAYAMATPQEKAMIDGAAGAAASGQTAKATPRSARPPDATGQGGKAHAAKAKAQAADAPTSETPGLDKLYDEAMKIPGMTPEKAGAFCSLIYARATSVGMHVDDWIEHRLAGLEYHDRTPEVSEILADPTNFTSADKEALADYALAQFHATGLISPEQAIEMIGVSKPGYLARVEDYLAKKLDRVRKGKTTPREVACALAITVASQGAGAMTVQRMREKLGEGHPFLKWMDSEHGQKFMAGAVSMSKSGRHLIRPEEAAAGWLMSPEGQRALAATDNGHHDPKMWRGLMDVRQAYGDDRFETVGTLGDSAIGGDKRKKLRMPDVGLVTKEINAAKGDIDKIGASLKKFAGIGEGKVGFIQHLIGLSGRTTVDAVQLNFWLTGHGDIKNLREGELGEQAEIARQLKKCLGNKRISEQVAARISAQMNSLADLIAKHGHERPSLHILHHWLWDAAKGLRTTHAPLYDTMEANQDGPASLTHRAPDGKLIPGKTKTKKDRKTGETTTTKIPARRQAGTVLGMVEFLRGENRAIIRAFKGADFPTLLHEAVHVFRRDLPPGDMETAARWAGAANGKWTRDAEERFVNGYMKHVRDGNAPTPAMKGVFQKVSGWLKGMYQWVRGSGLNVQLSPEIRGVFDRMTTPGAHAPGSPAHTMPPPLPPKPKKKNKAKDSPKMPPGGSASHLGTKFKIRRHGSKIRIVRYEQRHAPHTMTIAGRTFRGGWYIPDDYYAQATPQQKAMLVHAPTDVRPEPTTPVPAPYTRNDKIGLGIRIVPAGDGKSDRRKAGGA